MYKLDVALNNQQWLITKAPKPIIKKGDNLQISLNTVSNLCAQLGEV